MIVFVGLKKDADHPDRGSIMDIAFIATDNDLNEVARYHTAVQPANGMALASVAKLEMEHLGVGDDEALLPILLAGKGMPLFRVGNELEHWWSENLKASRFDEDRPILVGFNTPVVRSWLRAKLPMIEELFAPYAIDIASFRVADLLWHPDGWPVPMPQERALGDAEDGVTAMRTYKARFYG